VTVLAEAWHAGLADLSPITLQAYRDRLDRQILPRLGQLRIRELSVGTLDRQLRAIADPHGMATARMCRSVLSGMCTLAARHDALTQSPVRALGPVTGGTRKAPRALTVPQLRQLRAALSYDEKAVARDLPDLVGFLMATGLRIGEACALTWNAVDLDVGTVQVRAAAAVRVRGQGLVVKSTKTDAGQRTLVLPRWCTAMLRDRADRADRVPVTGADRDRRPVFPAAGRLARPLQHPSRPPGSPRRRRLRLGHLPRLSQDRGNPHGPSRPVLPGGSRPARPSQHVDDYRRLLRPQGRRHRRRRSTRGPQHVVLGILQGGLRGTRWAEK
jgi:integrase